MIGEPGWRRQVVPDIRRRHFAKNALAVSAASRDDEREVTDGWWRMPAVADERGVVPVGNRPRRNQELTETDLVRRLFVFGAVRRTHDELPFRDQDQCRERIRRLWSRHTELGQE
jgi:hypothetical protein